MTPSEPSNALIVSPHPERLSRFETVLVESGASVDKALNPSEALARVFSATRYNLVLLDASLPEIQTGQLLAGMQHAAESIRFPIVVVADEVPDWARDRLAEGFIHDVVPAAMDSSFWRVRLDAVERAYRAGSELEAIRESAAASAQFDRLTGIYNRETILSMLFRETDRVQRLRTPLGMMLFDIDDFGHWNSRLGADMCNQLLIQAVQRTSRLLRSYDLLGRVGKDEFLIGMPGSSAVNSVMLAERLRMEVFGEPFHVAGETVRLSACFGISLSHGRSPLVVLRETEQALDCAKGNGAESIQCFAGCSLLEHPPVTFLSPTSGEEVLAW